MKKHLSLENGLGWLSFLLAFVSYLLTLEPTVSFWDCGEFIATAVKMQVGHPPGAPFFMLSTNVFSLLAPSANKIAFMTNAFSALVSAATIMFLFWTIVLLGQKIVKESYESSMVSRLAVLASAFIGAMSYAFTDSFWFSAVETEVYAYSSLFTAVVFWAILKWEKVADKPFANRWIILITYLMGLSIGVHLLNLLAIPAIVFVYYFKKYKTTRNGILKAFGISVLLVGFVTWGVIPGVPKLAAKFELIFVNGLGMPFNSGLFALVLLIIGLLVYLIRLTQKKGMVLWNTAVLALTVMLIGYSSYAVIMIRSAANPPIDENNPETAYNLTKYLNREQYGSTPLMYGNYYNAPAVSSKKKKPTYYPEGDKYVKVVTGNEYEYDGRFRTFFPRMYSAQSSHVRGYKSWGNIKGRAIEVNGKKEQIPTFSENLRYFFRYQMGHMYFRYFMWNFSGRQNDVQGHGGALKGNWITGIKPIDKMLLGFDGKLPETMANPKTRNTYFMLPFLLGILGLFFHYKRRKKDFWVVMLLFFMTGIAIVIYLNQPPYQPRERDYAYAASFYAYSIWLGIGVLSLFYGLQKYLKSKGALAASVVLGLVVPTLLAAENWDDHDRSGRYMTRDYAQNYLNSCEPNSILFTYGDNDTFPLWYVQDVEEYRTDVRICNITLLGMDWYIDQMKQKMYDADPLPVSMESKSYRMGSRDMVVIRENIKQPVELKRVIDFIANDDVKTKLQDRNGNNWDFSPTRNIKITVDKEKVLKTGTVKPENAHLIVDSMVVSLKGNSLYKSDLAVLDMIANNDWERPIYFDLSVKKVSSLPFKDYLQYEGFAYRLVPIKTTGKSYDGFIDSDDYYDKLMNIFTWGGINRDDIFIDEYNKNTLQIVEAKPMFTRLGEQLFVEGKKDSALNVVNRLYELFPLNRIHPTSQDLMGAWLYFNLDEDAKGEEILNTISQNEVEKIEYLMGLGTNMFKEVEYDINIGISSLKEVVRLATMVGRKDIGDRVDQDVKRLAERLAS